MKLARDCARDQVSASVADGPLANELFLEQLNREQRGILNHTHRRAAACLFCGGSQDMQALVNAGLMESAGHKSFVPDEYFRLTPRGRALIKADGADDYVSDLEDDSPVCAWNEFEEVGP